MVPRDCSDVADLLRLPRTETPRMIITTPRVMKPEVGQKRGQLWAMYRRNMPISVMISATMLISSILYEEKLVGKSRRGDLRAKQPDIRWLTPSKKKNLETWKVLTSMPKLAATMAIREMMLQTRMMLRTT